MRNLRSIRYGRWRPPIGIGDRPISASAWDAVTDSVICTFGPTADNPLIELIRVPQNSASPSQYTLITSWDAPCPNPDLACDEVLSLQYFGDSLTACLVLVGGDIIVVREEPQPGEERIEIVGSVDAGITAARWSPDEELLAITTKENTLVFMSRQFEGVMDVAMTADDLKASHHVAVGWGKRETQFKGRGARAMRDPTIPEKIDEGVLSANDDSSVAISWRGDGAFLGVSSVEGASRRLIRVYSREGALDSVSEPVDNLEGALSWRPSGNLIASIQRFANHADVVFFERNGLRHGQFSLRLTAEELAAAGKSIKLAWNSDSTVLAVILTNSVQLWTMGNYHWYLKQELPIGSTDFVPTNPLLWHPEKALQLLLTTKDTTTNAEFIFATARGPVTPPHDLGAVAVIDGTKLKLTPMRVANVPPPMALHEIDLPANAIDVAVAARESLLVVLHQGGISVFDWLVDAKNSSDPTPRATFEFSPMMHGEEVPLQVTAAGDGELFVLQYQEDEACSVKKFVLSSGLEEAGRVESTPPAISSIGSFEFERKSHSFLQSSSGQLQSFTSTESHLTKLAVREELPHVEVCEIGGCCVSFRMSRNGHLYADSRLLAKNCTSFLVTSAHLIFTTTNHYLKFAHLTEVDELEVPPDSPETDERCRSIERGARLVTAMPDSLNLVMQMPRGNLETIWPRAMVVAGIRNLIEAKNYRAAFLHCRSQRVDMNILCDYLPEQFMANVGLFIDQVKKVSSIDLFLSSLREEDVTQTMYQETRPKSKIQPEKTPLFPSRKSKVNDICDAFLAALKCRDSTNLQNIVTANVCKVPPALKDGLAHISKLVDEKSDLAQNAVEHICFLADVNKLYQTALEIYHLDTALLVAQQSQMDPREYLPFLQRLQQMPETRRRFTIHDHFGNHKIAVAQLYQIDLENDFETDGCFEECKEYTQKHKLYTISNGLYDSQPARRDVLLALYAEHLEANSKNGQAGQVFEFLKDYKQATSCYQAATMWRECLFCASQQKPALSQDAFESLGSSLVDALLESKDYNGAATIQLNYLKDLPAAATNYCKGYQFATALELAGLHQQPDIFPAIDNALTTVLASTNELLKECREQLNAQVPRIVDLRSKAQQNPLAFFGRGDADDDGDLPDNVSVAASSRISTSASLFTRYTGRHSEGTANTGVSRATSKNRRREERKRARGKKGSVYEEEYLIASVGRLIRRVNTARGEATELSRALVRRHRWNDSKHLDNLMGTLVQECHTAMQMVFSVKVGESQMASGTEDQYRATGGDAVLQESLEAAQRPLEPPELGSFDMQLSLESADVSLNTQMEQVRDGAYDRWRLGADKV